MAIYKTNIGGSLLNGLQKYYPLMSNLKEDIDNENLISYGSVINSTNQSNKSNTAKFISSSNSGRISGDIQNVLNAQDVITISFWVKLVDFVNGWKCMLFYNTSTTAFLSINFSTHAINGNLPSIQFNIANSSTQARLNCRFGGNVFSDNEWHHVCFIASRFLSDRIAYIDLIPQTIYYHNGSSDVNTWTGGCNKVYLGSTSDEIANFNGHLNNIRMYDRILTFKEIEKLYYEDYYLISLPKKTTSKLEITDFSDLSSYALSSNIQDNKIASFNGSQRVVLPYLKTNKYFSIRTIFKWTGSNSEYIVSTATNNTDTEGLIIYITSNNQIGIFANGTIRYRTAVIEQDKWYDIIFSSDGTNGYVFIDGKIRSTIDVSSCNFTYYNSIILGDDDDGTYSFSGEIKNLTIWDGVVSEYYAYILYSNKYIDLQLFDNLVAYYPLNGDMKDNSLNSFNGTLYGSVLPTPTSDRYDVTDKSLEFSYANSTYSLASNINTLQLSNDFSISLHVYLINRTGISVGDCIFTTTNHSNNKQGIFVRFSNSYQIQVVIGNRSTPLSSDDINNFNNDSFVGKWFHLVIQRKNGYVEGYLDAVKKMQSTTYTTLDILNTNFIKLGSSTVFTERGINGYIDSFKVFDRVLNETEIKYLAKTRDYQLNNNLLAYYNFDNNVLNQVNTIYNLTLNATGVEYTTDRNLNPNSAIYTKDNTQIQRLTESTFNWINITKFSLSCWIKNDDLTDDRYVFSAGVVNTLNDELMIRFTRISLNRGIEIGTYGIVNRFNIGGSEMNDGQWHHYVFIVDLSNLINSKVYIDSVITTQDLADEGFISQTINGFNIGNRGTYTSYAVDYIDEFKLFNGEINQNKITELFNE